MINEWSRLLGQPSATGYTRFQLIFEGRLNEAEATATRKSDFDYLYLRLSAQHALILITPKPLKGAFCGVSPSFFHFVRQGKIPIWLEKTLAYLPYIDSFEWRNPDIVHSNVGRRRTI